MSARGKGSVFSAADRAQLSAHGIAPETALGHLERTAKGFPRIQLARPCTIGDGLLRLDAEEREACIAAFERARDRGRISKFVPASGAATRMFQALLSAQSSGLDLSPEALGDLEAPGPAQDRILSGSGMSPADAALTLRFLRAIEEFPFAPELSQALGRDEGKSLAGVSLSGLVEGGRGRWILESTLREPGLGFGSLPKGLIPFHRYVDGPRTPFGEHVAEGWELLGEGREGARIPLHFTVPPGFEEKIRDHLEIAAKEFPETRFEIELSTQSPSTDTVAADLEGGPFRTDDGRLVFRPGGHGALLRNLENVGGDIVLVKNIDNIARRSFRRRQHHFRRVLAGLVVRLEEQVQTWRTDLEAIESSDRGDVARLDALESTYAETFCRTLPPGSGPDSLAARVGQLRGLLDRPIRVCGMVRNEGEPGGGPFWVRQRDGSLDVQIVELSQVDRSDESQVEAVEGATHFNPVDLAVAVRNPSGQTYELSRFVDEESGIVAEKSDGGRPLKALELPGLWNGSMASWNTVFVEIPIETFTPVKTVLDLLRDPHRGRED